MGDKVIPMRAGDRLRDPDYIAQQLERRRDPWSDEATVTVAHEAVPKWDFYAFCQRTERTQRLMTIGIIANIVILILTLWR